MELKKMGRTIFIAGAAIALAACSAHKKHDQFVVDPNAAYPGAPNAAASGLGEEEGYVDRVGGKRAHSGRVYYFDYDSNVVHNEDKPAIIANADRILSSPHTRVMLEGHTDPRGSREYNIGLGERRARAVANIMTAKGVNPAQVRVVSYGAEKLASPGHTEADYQLDRRVVLVYLNR